VLGGWVDGQKVFVCAMAGVEWKREGEVVDVRTAICHMVKMLSDGVRAFVFWHVKATLTLS
jgi:hypothetical protein